MLEEWVVSQVEAFMNIRNTFETIQFEIKESIGYLTIDRPSKLNALNKLVFTELKEVLISIRSDESFTVKGILLIGSGEKAFIAGADILEMDGMAQADAEAFSRFGQEVSLLFETLPIPVIALVNGYALGGGLEMALSADFILCTQNALFGLPEVSLGLIPGFGGTQRLSRIIGINQARKLIYTAGNLDSKKALDVGLVLDVLETREELVAAGIKLMSKIMKQSPLAISKAKLSINQGYDLKLEDALEVEVSQFSGIFESKDMIEGTAAFLEKRKPKFLGK